MSNGCVDPLSLTSIVQAAVDNVIEQHRLSIDQMRGVSQITIIVNFDEKRNVPRKVSIRPELTGRADGDGESS